MNTLCGAPSISSLLASLSFHVLSSPSKLLWQQSFAEAQCLLPAGRHTAGSLWSVFVKKMSRYLITLAAGLTSAPKFSLQFNIIHEFNWKLTSDYSPNHDNENCDSLLVSCFTLVGFAVYVRNYCRRNFCETFPFSPNQSLTLDFFCRFLQQNGSNIVPRLSFTKKSNLLFQTGRPHIFLPA